MAMRLSFHGHYNTGMGYETIAAREAFPCNTYLVRYIICYSVVIPLKSILFKIHHRFRSSGTVSDYLVNPRFRLMVTAHQ